MSSPTPLLTLSSITTGDGTRPVIHGFDLEVFPAEIVAVLGEPNSGKSTLFGVIAHLIPYSDGIIRFAGSAISGKTLETLVQSGMAFVPQHKSAFVSMSVEENLRLGMTTLLRHQAYQDRLDQIFAYFPRLRERRHHRAKHLSSGEQRLLEIARAMMPMPELLVLDEPSFGLSPYIRHEIFQTLHALNKNESLTILMFDQVISQAIEICHRGYLLQHGRTVFAGDGSQMAALADVTLSQSESFDLS